MPVLLTTDHGSIHCHTPATVFAKRDTTSNLRYKFGDDLRAQDADAALVVEDLRELRPARRARPAPGCCSPPATGSSSIPPSCASTRRATAGAFLHGGVSPEEVILPIALLTPRRG